MDNETKLLLEIWQNVRDIIPTNRREDSALMILKAFEEYGFDIDQNELHGEDEYLDAALDISHDCEDTEWDC
jgi:hypothetical protein